MKKPNPFDANAFFNLILIKKEKIIIIITFK